MSNKKLIKQEKGTLSFQVRNCRTRQKVNRNNSVRIDKLKGFNYGT